MRLLHTENLELTEFIGNDRPPYAILSHTWGDGEILFGDVQQGRSSLVHRGKAGLSKVLNAAAVARKEGYDYIWIDTCCIDKSSSAELSEAINSMFAWYRDAAVCYAYISDFDSTGGVKLSGRERWFTRGWTLQELIAPTTVEFYDRSWAKFGDRSQLATLISTITGIDEEVFSWHSYRQCPTRATKNPFGFKSVPVCRLCYRNVAAVLDSFCVATRMSWAAARTTTREEDVAYSLLGIFSVNMPLLYGEGDGAFLRLQQEIVRKSADQSIFAFTAPRHLLPPLAQPIPLPNLFARSPSWFRRLFDGLTNDFSGLETRMTLSNIGVELDLYIAPCMREEGIWIAVLGCSWARDTLSSPAFLLRETPSSSTIRSFNRVVTARFRGPLLSVSVGSDEARAVTDDIYREIIKFDATKLRRETIVLQASSQTFIGPFRPPVSRVQSFCRFDCDLEEIKHYAPPRVTVHVRGPEDLSRFRSPDRNPPLITVCSPVPSLRGDSTVVCGVICFRFFDSSEGLVVVWGNNRVPNTLMAPQDLLEQFVALGEYWWREDSVKGSWYAQVYPWTRQASCADSARVSMAEDMSGFTSVQRLLSRCRDEDVPLTKASDMVCDLDGSCERTWVVAALGARRVKAKVTIEPVEFLGRQVLDIAVRVEPVDKRSDDDLE